VVKIRLFVGDLELNESLTEKEASLPARKSKGKSGEFNRFSDRSAEADFIGSKKFLLTISAS